jgi:hypothetical protein
VARLLPHPSMPASKVPPRGAPPRALFDESFVTSLGPFDESFEPFDESFEPFDESFEPFDEVDEGIDVTIAEKVEDSAGSVRSVRLAGSSAVLGSSAAAPPSPHSLSTAADSFGLWPELGLRDDPR